MTKFSELEIGVMRLLLSGEDKVSSTLREQFRVSSVKNRRTTTAGFHLYFFIPEGTEVLGQNASLKFGDVIAEIPSLEFGAGFLLSVSNGILDYLEGYSYEEPWPDQVMKFILSRNESLSRDRQAIFEKLSPAETEG